MCDCLSIDIVARSNYLVAFSARFTNKRSKAILRSFFARFCIYYNSTKELLSYFAIIR